MKRWPIVFVILLFVVGGDTAVAKQNLTVELFYSAAWHDVTTRVYTRDQITINHGAGNEQTGVVPSDASLTFDNRDGEMNPENRRSSLFGLIGHNTPIRIKVGSDTRFSGQIVSWKPRRAIKGDAWVNIQAQGTIRRLGQGEPPVRSAMRRSIAAMSPQPVLYWPLEGGKDEKALYDVTGTWPTKIEVITGSRVGSVAFGALPLDVGSLDAANVAGVSDATSLNQMVMEAPGALAATGRASFQFAFHPGTKRWANGGVFRGAILTDFAQSPFYLRFAVEVFYNSTFRIIVGEYNSVTDAAVNETTSSFVTISPYMYDGRGLLFHVDLVANGANSVDWTAYLNDVQALTGNRTTTASNMLNIPIQRVTARDGVTAADGATATVGHYAVWTSAVSVGRYAALTGYDAEKAGDRFNRLCTEEGITATIVGTAAETQVMGPQYPDKTLNLLSEIARTDAGIIHDTRSQLGLTFRTGRSLYNQ